MSTKEKHLYYLSELKDYKVNSKDSDIRGWQVKDLDKRVIGKVDDLLVNMDLGKVVYIDVEVDQAVIDTKHDPYSASADSQIKEFINKDGENHIIIPIGLIDINLEDKYVYTESIDYQTFAETKRYRSGSGPSREYEHHVLDSYDRRKNFSGRETVGDAYRNDVDSTTHASETELEARIRREKEKLKYKSDERKSPLTHQEPHNRSTDRFIPERTLDEEENWHHDRSGFEDEVSIEEKLRRKTHQDDFYDREEFRHRKRF
ncbi:hypothetical protein GCM10023115_49790 [Pontixanthobacter gangjinensis]|uniref:PRC-barrel domain containing protein n=1 Tax=Christiangramia aestuarii TaxID=1028746 RepID=A0A7K1LPY6_9FLAO|nr:PRC-barrel domain-containing protein [Christiangramia aestuarii]MUP42560.1 hypothetical protein [Christiangramia aestuarii]